MTRITGRSIISEETTQPSVLEGDPATSDTSNSIETPSAALTTSMYPPPDTMATVVETSTAMDEELEELYEELRVAILAAMTSDLDDLETSLEQAMLEEGSYVNFAKYCNPTLQDLHDGLKGLPADTCAPILENVVIPRLRTLWDQHMQMLRDLFGSRYETLLDESIDAPEKWQTHAQTITEAFRQLAQDSIPNLARPGEVFRDFGLDYVGALQGLVNDMMEATSIRQEEQDEQEELMQAVEEESSSTSGRIARWYEKVAARALVLAVNYFQGWLAWQGLKRAALERERNMPKFPLF